MGKIIGIVTPGGKAEKNAKDLAKNADFHIILKEDFYKMFWDNPDKSEYTSMIDIKKQEFDIEETKQEE